MTGAGAPGGPGIIRCLQQDSRIRLICCDIDPNASGRYLSGAFEQILPADDPDFISHMIKLCERHQVDVIFPLVTKELFKFSAYLHLFQEKGIGVIVSSYEELAIANDKGKLLAHLKSNELVHPHFNIVSTYEQLDGSLNMFLSDYGKACIKPCHSNGSRGVRLIDDSIDPYDLLFNHKPTSLYTRKEELLQTLVSKKFPQLIVTELLDGEEFTVDSLVVKGKPVLIAPRIRTKMNSGISVAGKFIEELAIIEQVKSICNTLSLNGPIGFQFKKNTQKGVFHLLEINPRIQGTSVALLGAGVNLPLLALYSALGISYQIPKVKWGTQFIRYYSEVYFE